MSRDELGKAIERTLESEWGNHTHSWDVHVKFSGFDDCKTEAEAQKLVSKLLNQIDEEVTSMEDRIEFSLKGIKFVDVEVVSANFETLEVKE